MASFIIFLLISAIPILIPKVSCQVPTCGNNTFFIQYPFLLLQENQNLDHHFDQGIILRCSKQGSTTLNLPSSGDFYVRDIDYFEQKIQLYDPGNCLPGRLMNNFSLPESSPFWAVSFKNYTFFRCHSRNLTGFLNYSLSVVGCLSNSKASVVVTSLVPRNDREIVRETGCKVIANLQIPDFDYEKNGVRGDLVLAWNEPTCGGDCEGTSSHSRPVVSIIIICLITISTGILVALFCIGFCIRLVGKIVEVDQERTPRHRYRTRPRDTARPTFHPPQASGPNERAQMSVVPTTAMSPQARSDSPFWLRDTARPTFHPPQASGPNEWAQMSVVPNTATSPQAGSDSTFWLSPEAESTISDFQYTSCTEELMIGGKQWISGPNSDSCPICLGEYQASDRLRRVCICDHCFHAHCLEMWLQRKNTCPVCRTSID